VIAFSLPEVYELAERIRIKRGGAAVVLGALSPRTRNAQVAMYQAGEVDYLVATDAIGMGLNLAVDHVAFASTRKFDGTRVRDLEVAEFAQIAGRAGRHVSNGTFGTLRPCHLPDALCRAIEQHRFPPEQTAIWRNADLCFDSVPRLLESLSVKPSRQGLRPTACAEDYAVLRLLAERPRVRELAVGTEAVSLLWESCQIPDYRKLLPELHAELVGGIFEQLVTQGGTISETWLGERLERLAVLEGDLDTLIARISFVRTWTYVTHRRAWLKHAHLWQERARAIEDALSDALHERLVQRFVEAGRKARGGRAERLFEEALAGPFGKLALLRGAEATRAGDSVASATEGWVESVVSAEASELRLGIDGQIEHGQTTLGRLRRGKDILQPELVLADLAVGAGARQRIQRRLMAHTRDLVAELLRGLSAPDDASAALRGLIYQLRQGLGCVSTSSAQDQLAQLSVPDRGRLQAAGVVFGQRVVFLKSSLRARCLLSRAALTSAYFELAPAQLNAERVSLPREHGLPSALYLARGFYPAGPRVIRCDVLERALTRITEGAATEAQLGNLLGCPRGEVRAIRAALGLAQRQHQRAAQTGG
jgi:ATP-dependent RNA helicase SUPV3L1/SUV3